MGRGEGEELEAACGGTPAAVAVEPVGTTNGDDKEEGNGRSADTLGSVR